MAVIALAKRRDAVIACQATAIQASAATIITKPAIAVPTKNRSTWSIAHSLVPQREF
ncbi:hypothetical protein [Bradyrhizobium rifense]|uniref:hypothetical protein n=1 Tax=Bradyrhizobium rifense TaxID=515499 RepID=UPI001652D775|nr:hypothetical protein [Bradyrhizobium rifense]